MKVHHLWPALVVGTTVCSAVIPSQQVLSDLKDAIHRESENFPSLKSAADTAASTLENVLDETLESASNAWRTTTASASDAERYWLNDFFSRPIDDDDADNLPKDLSQVSPVYRMFPPRHPPSNKTIYELIAESKYTTILAKIINEDDELVHLLNSTSSNHTVFAPTDDAFKKLHHHHGHEPSKELIRAVIRYHVAPGIYTAPQVFHSHTLPSVLEDSSLGEGLPQRLAVRVGLKGLTVNYYSRIIAIDIAGSNGVIHAIDSVLIPPPKACTLIEIVPTQFSTFALGILTSGLTSHPNASFLSTTPNPILSKDTDTETETEEWHHKGSTILAPSNTAFQKLGLKINAFLFSPHGHKYLRALLAYHIVPNRTLYSDVYYTSTGKIQPLGTKGFTHLDLPTLLPERSLAVDVSRYGPYASITINGHQRVAFEDVLARDGNIHIVDHVLIPPRKVDDAAPDWTGNEDELTVEDLKSRLVPSSSSSSDDDDEGYRDDGGGEQEWVDWGRGVEL